MSVKKEKDNIFKKLSILKTTYELEKQSLNKRVDLIGNLESSKLKNKKDSFSFIIDILTILVGQDVIKQGVTKIVSKVGVIEKDFKSTIKHDLLSGFNSNTTPLPNKVSSGFKIPISKLDPFGSLSLDSTSQAGKLALGKANSTLSTLSNIVKNNVQGFKPLNQFLNVSYNASDGMLTVMPVTNLALKPFVESYIDNMKLIDKEQIIKDSLALLFNLNPKNNKSQEAQLLDEQLLTVITKISSNEEDDSYFKFDTSTFLSDNSRVRQSSALITEVGCGTTSTTVTLDDITKIFSGSTKSFSSAVIEKTLNNVADNVVASNDNKNVNASDIQSIRNNFFSKLINYLKLALLKGLIYNPEVQIVFAMIDVVKNKPVLPETPLEQIISRKKTIKCIIENIMHNIVKILFGLLRKELLQLISSVALIYAKESIDKYKKIITSKVKPK